MATKEQWKEFFRSVEGKELPLKQVERVIELTPVESSILVQLGTVDRFDGSATSRKAQEDFKVVKELLSEKYGFELGLKEGRACFWILDGKIAVFSKESGIKLGG